MDEKMTMLHIVLIVFGTIVEILTVHKVYFLFQIYKFLSQAAPGDDISRGTSDRYIRTRRRSRIGFVSFGLFALMLDFFVDDFGQRGQRITILYIMVFFVTDLVFLFAKNFAEYFGVSVEEIIDFVKMRIKFKHEWKQTAVESDKETWSLMWKGYTRLFIVRRSLMLVYFRVKSRRDKLTQDERGNLEIRNLLLEDLQRIKFEIKNNLESYLTTIRLLVKEFGNHQCSEDFVGVCGQELSIIEPKIKVLEEMQKNLTEKYLSRECGK